MTAPLTKIKNAGVFKTVSGIQVKESGIWKRVVKGQVNQNGTWKTFFVNKTTVTIPDVTANIDLDNYFLITAEAKLGDVDVIIPGDVFVYSDDVNVPAFKTGTEIEGILTIIFNDGYIVGAGGTGGTGGNSAANGGGGGGRSFGIGGTGSSEVSGSTPRSGAANGSAGDRDSSGNGGAGANVDGDAIGGTGGAGGAGGANGSDGSNGSGESVGAGGAGGAAGTAISNDGSFTTS